MTITDQVLGPLLRVDPARPRITHYDDAAGSRVELSGATLANWAAKTGNLLRDELGGGPASRVAVLLPAQLWYPGYGRMAVKVLPEIPVPAEGTRAEKIAVMCQQLADAYAEGIAAHPQDWHMLQKFFLADLDPARAPKAKPEPDSDSEPGSERVSAEEGS